MGSQLTRLLFLLEPFFVAPKYLGYCQGVFVHVPCLNSVHASIYRNCLHHLESGDKCKCFVSRMRLTMKQDIPFIIATQLETTSTICLGLPDSCIVIIRDWPS